jgi:uncharacterized membrane-anchored protein YitT (DUF2179 family)
MNSSVREWALGLGRHVWVRRTITSAGVVLSALMEAFALQVFVRHAGLLSGGFTGLAILVDRITALGGTHIPTFAGMIIFNVPVAALCWKHISKRFVSFSLAQVFLSSFFLRISTFPSLFDDTLLCVLFGGFIYGLSIAIALKCGASTGGTDYIALMVSNRTGRTIWAYVFAGNCVLLSIFGMLFGWEHAAYSIIFQFISTKTISAFYHRYERVTLQITTRRPLQIMDAYQSRYHHGASCLEGFGGYSHQKVWLLVTVISAYEQDEIVRLMRDVDPHAVINVLRTETFYGGFYRGAIDEPLPQELPPDEGQVLG